MTDLEKDLMEDVRFIVDKENRIVKCLPKWAGPLGLQRAAEVMVANMVDSKMKMFVVPRDTLLLTPVFRDYRLNKNQCFAVAKCSPNDVFDEKIGKRIAFNRLKLRLEKVAAKVSAKIAYNAYQALGYFDLDTAMTVGDLANDRYNSKKEE